MIKILFVMQALYNGGAERSLVNLFNELPDEEYEIDLLLFKQAGMFLSQVPKNVHILETPSELKMLYGPLKKSGKLFFTKLSGNIFSRFSEKNILEIRAYRWEKFYSKKIKKLDKKYDVAVAYISGEIMSFVDEKVEATRKYAWIHNDYRTAKHPKKYDYKRLERMDGIVSISEKCVDILKEEFPAFEHKIHFIENITSSVFARKRAEEFVPEEIHKDYPTIVSIGRLNNQKGFDYAVDAAKLLKEKNIKFRWLVLGNGELEEELKEQAARCGVSEEIQFIGPRENPYAYMKNCTIFAQTSRYEGKSVVLDEAKIIGVPIVVTNYPTVRDQIVDNAEGLIVDMSAEGISTGIELLLTNEEKRVAIRDYLLTHEYGNQKEIKKYMDLFEGK